MAGKSKIKCPICNGCTHWILIGPNRFIHCLFCNKYWKLLPGLNLESITMEALAQAWKEYME